jgi:hypothetical protein
MGTNYYMTRPGPHELAADQLLWCLATAVRSSEANRSAMLVAADAMQVSGDPLGASFSEWLHFGAVPERPRDPRPSERGVHIGKSSAGWVFSLHVYPAMPGFPQSLDDYRKCFADGWVIHDEYGGLVEPAEMLRRIVDRTGYPDGQSPWTPGQLRNHAHGCEVGPRGLARSKISPDHCIGHGPGEETYSLIVGEFC